MKITLFLNLAQAIVATSALAQPFTIERHVVAGGGGPASGGTFTVNGTVGQHDAGPPSLIGGSFSIIGGFWSRATIPPPLAPMLFIERLREDVRVFWPLSATGFVLDESFTIDGGWSPVSFPYNTNETDISITVPAPTGSRFYRLRKP